MATHRDTALALARNLQRLMDHHELSQAQLGKKSGVGQRTLSTLLDVEHPLEINPRSTTIDQLATYFGIPSWQLLVPNLSIDLLLSNRLAELITNYTNASDQGRKTIDRIAESEVRYTMAEGLKKTG
jgi:transcriptional regulator with XRE-family HTH domain